MAAGAYKGLTIRLGADTTKLTTALGEASTAAYKTQGELNKLKKAANIDPGNINVATRQIGQLGAQSTIAAQQMLILSGGVKKLGEVPLKTMVGDVATLARNTESTALAAARAKTEYLSATTALKKLYTEMGQKTGQSFRNFDGTTSKEEIEARLNTAKANDKISEAEVAAYLKEVERLKGEWNHARDALDDYTNAAKFDSMNNDLASQEAHLVSLTRELAQVDRYASSGLSELAERVGSANERLVMLSAASETVNDRLSRLDTAIELDPTNLSLASERAQAMGEAMLVTETRAQALRERIAAYENLGIDKVAKQFDSVALEVEKSEMAFAAAQEKLDELKATGVESGVEFDTLKQKAQAAQERMDTAHACQQYENLKAELFEVNGELSSLARASLDIHLPSDVARGYADLKERVSEISSSLQQVSGNVSSLESALNLNPDNVLVAQAAMDQLREEERLATEQAAALREELSHYDLSAIDAAADKNVSATTQLLDARDAAREADEALRKYREGIATVEIELARLDEKKVWDEGDLQAAEQYAVILSSLKAGLSGYQAAADSANKHLDLSRGRAEVQGIEVELAKADARLDSTFVSMQKLSGAKVVPDIDLDAARDVLKDLEDRLKSLGDGSTGKVQVLGDIKPQYDLLAAALKAAEERANTLKAALKLDPANLVLTSQYASALAEKERFAAAQAEIIKTALSQVPTDSLNQAAVTSGTIGTALAQSGAKAKAAAERVKEVTKRLEDLKNEAKDVKEIDVKTHPEKIEDLKRRIEELEAELEEAKRDAESAFSDFGKNAATEAVRSLKDEVSILGSTAKDAKEQLEAVMEKGGEAVLKPGKEAQEKTEKWSAAAVQAAHEIGQAFKRATREIMDAGVQIDSAYRDMRKTVNGTEKEYEGLYNAAMKYSQTHVTSADTMLEMEALAGQVGIATDAVQSFAETAANLTVATDISSDSIALQMGQLVNIMDDLDQDEVDHFADSLVRLGNNMPAQESAIMEVTQRMAAQANIIGMTTPQVLGWAGAVASTGQHAEAAGTAISRTMAIIEAAVAGGTESLTKFEQSAGFSASALRDLWNTDQTSAIEKIGTLISSNSEALEYFAQLTDQTAEEFQFAYEDKADEASLALVAAIGEAQDKLKLFAEVSGTTADDFAETWSTDPSKALQMFYDGLAKVDEGGQSLEGVLKDLGISSVRQKQGVESLVKTVDILDNSLTMSQNAWDGTSDAWGDAGDAAVEAQKKAEGLSGAVDKMNNSAQVLAATLGPALVPFVDAAAGGLQMLTGWLNSLSDGTKSAAVGIAGFMGTVALAVPPIVALYEGWHKFAAGIANSKLATVINDMGGLKEAISPVIDLFGKLFSASNALATGFGVTALLVGGAYAKVLGGSITETMRFNDVLNDLASSTDGLHGALWNGKNDLSVYGDSWKDLRVDMDKFFSDMEGHNRVNAETRDEATTTIGQLERWRDVIDEAAGKGNDFAGSELELQTAIEGLNEVLGTNYDKADVLAGVYADQSGAVKDLRAEIDRLVDAKKREIRLGALEDIYKEDIKAQAEAQNAYDKALAARDKFLDEWKERNLGKVWHDVNQGKDVTIDESNWQSFAEGTPEMYRLNQAIEETGAILKETGEQLDITEKQWEGYSNELAFVTSNNFGLREGIMLTNQKIAEAIMANTDWGQSLEEIQPNVKTLADGLEKAKVGVTEFNELATQHPDLFGEMLVEADGDMDKLISRISEWNMAQLEEKYGKFDYDKQEFVDAEGDRVAWNEDEWEPVNLEVNDYVSGVLDKVKYNIGEITNEAGVSLGELMLSLEEAGISAEQFASVSEDQFRAIAESANGNVEAIIAVIAQLNGTPIDDKTAEFHFDEEGNLVDAENQRVAWNDSTHMWDPVEVEAESNVEEAVDEAKDYVEGQSAEIEVDADTSAAEEGAAEAKAKIESEPIEQTVTVKQEGDVSAATSNVQSDTEVKVIVTTDTTQLEQLNTELDSVPPEVPVNIIVTADTSETGGVLEALATIPEEVPINIKATQSGVSSAARNIKVLSENASKMSDTKATYTANGNAALNRNASNNISSLNAAARSMASKYATYTAAGNAATSDSPADRIWNLVNAARNLVSKTITLTTNNVIKTTKSATGAYIEPNRMPRHAAGIFTRPTLTNIGWVGEDGAELYSGNSLIPLTNRKYSMPYINDISDAVAKKLGPVDQSPTINITINGVSGPDETADAIERKLRLLGF